MVDTIFQKLSFDRNEVKWEDYLLSLTPIQTKTENGLTMQFKRGDYFAPLGYGGINGDKLRTAIWLYHQHFLKYGSGKIVHGALLGSPQICMMSSIAKHFNSSITTVCSSSVNTALKHESIKFGNYLGSHFSFVKSGYKTVLMKKALEFKVDPSVFLLETGTTVCHKKNDPKVVTGFHEVSSHQVDNITEETEDLIIPFGGSNSSIGIFMGLSKNLPKGLKRVHLFGIGPDKTSFFLERLKVIKESNGEKYKNILDFTLNGLNVSVDQHDIFSEVREPRFEVLYYDLSKKYDYSDLVEEKFTDEVVLHPRYEAKVLKELKESFVELIKPSSLFWIVGSEPKLENVLRNLSLEYVEPEIKLI